MPAYSLDSRVNDEKLSVYSMLGLVRRDYELRRLRSLATLKWPLRHVNQALGRYLAEEITTEILEDYVLMRRNQVTPHGKPVSDASIKTELAMLHRAYSLAVRHRLVGRNDVPSFPTIGQEKLKVRKGFFREAEVRAVLPRLDADVADYIEFLYVTAWRPNEGRRLLWEWCYWDDEESVTGEIHVPVPDKAGNRRSIPIAGEISDIIRRRLARQLGPYVFHRGGRPIGDVRKQWLKACEGANLPPRIVYDLRRSGIKRMVEKGIDTNTAMRFSGHTTTSTFRRYDIVDMSRMRAAAETLQRKEPQQQRRLLR